VKRLKNTPNILTSMRLCLVPVFYFIYFSDLLNAHLFALIIFMIAGITDFLDGYIARKYHQITPFGTVFDPLADKLMLLTALICLHIDHSVPFWILLIMLVKELFMICTGVYLYLRKEKLIIPSNIFGKLATVVFSLSIVLLLWMPNAQWLQYLLILAVGFKLTAFSSYVTFMIRRKSHH